MCYFCFEILDSYLNHKSFPCNPNFTNESFPLFVTWKIDPEQQLRGCIGTFNALPLHSALKNYALSSALKDDRFQPISREELIRLHVCVSLLLQFEVGANYKDWIIGVHGNRNKRVATYLPEVAVEQGWNHAETIDSLLRKGGYRGHITEEVRLNILRRSVFHHIDSHSVLNSDEWQLRYHQSSWLHKEFLIRDRKKSKSIDRNDAIVTVKNSDPINQSDSKENIYDGDDVGVDFDDEDVHHHQQPQQTSSTSSFSDMVTKSTSSNDYCDDENGCSRCFQPSTHCERKMNDRFWSIRMDPSLSVDELLAISPIETSMKEENRRTMKFQQCHALNDSIIDEMCQNDRRSIRKELLQNLHLRSCRRFLVKRSLNNHLYSLVINTTDCSRILKELLMLDNLVEELACEYESILHRYDCKAKWSVYAGEPVFLCVDPNIPFNKKITPEIPFGDKDFCYDICDLEPCFNNESEAPKLDCPLKLLPKTVPNISTVIDSDLEESNIEIDVSESFTGTNDTDSIENIDSNTNSIRFDYSDPFNVDDLAATENLENFETDSTTEFVLPTLAPNEEIELEENFFDDFERQVEEENLLQLQSVSSTIDPLTILDAYPSSSSISPLSFTTPSSFLSSSSSSSSPSSKPSSPGWMFQPEDEDYLKAEIDAKKNINHQTISMQFVETKPTKEKKQQRINQRSLDKIISNHRHRKNIESHCCSSNSKHSNKNNDREDDDGGGEEKSTITTNTIDPGQAQSYQDSEIYLNAIDPVTKNPFESTDEETLIEELNSDTISLLKNQEKWSETLLETASTSSKPATTTFSSFSSSTPVSSSSSSIPPSLVETNSIESNLDLDSKSTIISMTQSVTDSNRNELNQSGSISRKKISIEMDVYDERDEKQNKRNQERNVSAENRLRHSNSLKKNQSN
ncbi:AMMECR1-like protein 2 [Sarcoptes scabiei]|uniref:AMMECR1-like protein 2 n=1 Tax=Sarcoptes scabiei TaxID=52283 RepID=A0A131ZZE0_SARSC|nr:AMMECR1-like protein 2 [Sarcoptes scabiei]